MLFPLLELLLVLSVGTKLISATPIMTWYTRRKKMVVLLQVGKIFLTFMGVRTCFLVISQFSLIRISDASETRS